MIELNKLILFKKGIKFQICSNVYSPSDDTYLLIDSLKINKESTVLEIGTGTGIIALYVALTAKRVVAVDINPFAVLCAKKNVKLNRLQNKIEVRYSNLFSNISQENVFDIVIFNTPYLPPTKTDLNLMNWIEYTAWTNRNPQRILTLFLSGVKKNLASGGVFYFTISTLLNFRPILKKFEKEYTFNVINSKKFFYETIFVFRGKLND